MTCWKWEGHGAAFSPLLVCSTAASFQVCQFCCRLLMRLHVLFLFTIYCTLHIVTDCSFHLHWVSIQAPFVCNGKQTKIPEDHRTHCKQIHSKWCQKVHSGTDYANDVDKKFKISNTSHWTWDASKSKVLYPTMNEGYRTPFEYLYPHDLLLVSICIALMVTGYTYDSTHQMWHSIHRFFGIDSQLFRIDNRFSELTINYL